MFQSLNSLSISVIRYSVRTHIALGPIPNDLEYNLEKLGISYNVETLQKSILLGTANILRKVLSIKQWGLEKKIEKWQGGGGLGKREKEGVRKKSV